MKGAGIIDQAVDMLYLPVRHPKLWDREVRANILSVASSGFSSSGSAVNRQRSELPEACVTTVQN